MRVSFVTNFIPPYRKSFYEKLALVPGFAWQVVRGRVDVETGRPDYKGPIAAPTVQVRNREFTLGPFTLRWQQGVLHEVSRFDPEVLVLLGMSGNASNWLLLLWARLTGRRVCIWACGWEPQRPGSLALWFKQRLMRRYFSLADHSLVYSSKAQRYLAGLGLDERRITVCYNGIETDPMLAEEPAVRERAAALRAEHLQAGEFLFLYVGGLLADKRVELLLRAFAEVRSREPSAVLWVVGDGPARQRLEQQCRDQGLSGVRFWGRIVEEADPFFAAADAFVLPGIGGLAFNQAMFWGTPCIGSEADGTEEDLIVDGQTGLRFAPGDQPSLRDSMLTAVRLPPPERQRLGQAARALILERSNVNVMVQTFRKTLSTLAQERAAA